MTEQRGPSNAAEVEAVHEALTTALAEFSITTNASPQDVKTGATIFRAVINELINEISPSEPIGIAFDCVLLEPSGRASAIAVAVKSRLLVAWHKGLFRSKTGLITIPLAPSTSISAGPGDFGIASVPMSIVAETPAARVALAVPPDAAVAEKIVVKLVEEGATRKKEL